MSGSILKIIEEVLKMTIDEDLTLIDGDFKCDNFKCISYNHRTLVFCNIKALEPFKINSQVFECFDCLKFSNAQELKDFVYYNCPEIPKGINIKKYFGMQYFYDNKNKQYYILNFVN